MIDRHNMKEYIQSLDRVGILFWTLEDDDYHPLSSDEVIEYVNRAAQGTWLDDKTFETILKDGSWISNFNFLGSVRLRYLQEKKSKKERKNLTGKRPHD